MPAEQLQVMIKVVSPRYQSEKVTRTIRSMLGSIKSRAGCLDCRVFHSVENPEEITLLEEWRDEAAFTAHVNARDYRYVLEWMEMSSKQPEVTISHLRNRDGFKYIERLIGDGAGANRN